MLAGNRKDQAVSGDSERFDFSLVLAHPVCSPTWVVKCFVILTSVKILFSISNTDSATKHPDAIHQQEIYFAQ